MVEISKERVEELKGYVAENARDSFSYTVRLAFVDLLAILDGYSSLRAEVKRLNTWHTTLSEAWKARAEKAEAELMRAEDRHHVDLMELHAQEAELARQAPLIQAVMKMGDTYLLDDTDWPTTELYKAALALREEKK